MPRDGQPSFVRRLPLRAWLLAIFLACFGLSTINLPHPRDFLFEHILTLALLALLVAFEWRRPLSPATYGLIFLFLLLHVVGAHYTYSHVPYDDWSQRLLGVRLSDVLGFASHDGTARPRNHFDRLTHFSFGLLMLQPMRELVQRGLSLHGWRATLVAASFLCVLGTLYELLEWAYAVRLTQQDAELYNGQQGDDFDAHKDLALNIAGSTISAAAIGLLRLARGRRYRWRAFVRADVSGA